MRHKQDDRSDHRYGERKAVRIGDAFGIPEQEEYDQGGRAQDKVDQGDIKLPPCTCRIAHLKMRHPVQAGSFGNHSERACYQCL